MTEEHKLDDVAVGCGIRDVLDCEVISSFFNALSSGGDSDAFQVECKRINDSRKYQPWGPSSMAKFLGNVAERAVQRVIWHR